MNKSNAEKIVPSGFPHSVPSAIDRKVIAERVIEEILLQIKMEDREPTRWESDGLSRAMGDILFGSYTLAIVDAMSCFLKRDEVTRTDSWWDESESHTVQSLNNTLQKITGYPPKVNF